MKSYKFIQLADGASITINGAGDKLACYSSDASALIVQFILEDGSVTDRTVIAPSIKYDLSKRGLKFRGFIVTNESGSPSDGEFVAGFDDFFDARAAVTISTVSVNQAAGSNPWIVQPELMAFSEGGTVTVNGSATALISAAPTKQNRVQIYNTHGTEVLRIGDASVAFSGPGQGVRVSPLERVVLENVGFRVYGISDGSNIDIEVALLEAS